MEREKQKKAENERLERERKEAMMFKPQDVPIQQDGNGYEPPPKSKFVCFLCFVYELRTLYVCCKGTLHLTKANTELN